jgi:hypothetical protein
MTFATPHLLFFYGQSTVQSADNEAKRELGYNDLQMHF